MVLDLRVWQLRLTGEMRNIFRFWLASSDVIFGRPFSSVISFFPVGPDPRTVDERCSRPGGGGGVARPISRPRSQKHVDSGPEPRCLGYSLATRRTFLIFQIKINWYINWISRSIFVPRSSGACSLGWPRGAFQVNPAMRGQVREFHGLDATHKAPVHFNESIAAAIETDRIGFVVNVYNMSI